MRRVCITLDFRIPRVSNIDTNAEETQPTAPEVNPRETSFLDQLRCLFATSFSASIIHIKLADCEPTADPIINDVLIPWANEMADFHAVVLEVLATIPQRKSSESPFHIEFREQILLYCALLSFDPMVAELSPRLGEATICELTSLSQDLGGKSVTFYPRSRQSAVTDSAHHETAEQPSLYDL